ncbi:hypothetical protein ACFL6X_09190, partial [Candidatus Latescibacterota bacterium]
SSHRDLLDTRTQPAIDAGVDTYIYTTGWGFGIGLHDSQVGSILKTTDGHLSRNQVGVFTANGTDCLRITADYVRSLGREFFWGMRMNDTHDAGYGNVFMPENQFKADHPEVMFGPGSKHGAVTAVDYAEARVRDFAVRYIMDVVDRYDVDGIFLDFYRHPVFFRSNSAGLPATDSERSAMNSFMRDLKRELDRRRLADGRYYLVSVRVPDSVEYCRAIGLDIEAWLDESLADILSTASYLQFNDWEYTARLAHRYGVPAYSSLDESRVRNEGARHKRNCVRGYYGRVMNAWDAGCDGILMFNNSGLRDVGDSIEQNWFGKHAGSYREALSATARGRDFVNTLSKTYFVSVRGVGGVAGGSLPHQEYIRIPTLSHQAPVSISAGARTEVLIRIADDIGAAGNNGRTPTAAVSMSVASDPRALAVSLNHTSLDIQDSTPMDTDPPKEGTDYLVSALIPVDVLRTGENVFALEATEDMALLDLWVDVDYPLD